MRPSATSSPALPDTATPPPTTSDWHTLARLFPYLWEYKWRVMAALSFMVGAKLANVGVPVLLKNLIDQMTPQPTGVQVLLVVPAASHNR